MTFLDEQLDRVYLSENFEKNLSKVKSKSASIGVAMENGNLFKVRSLLNSFTDVSLDELMQVAHTDRRFHRFHLEAKKHVRGDKTQSQKFFVLVYGAAKVLQLELKDKSTLAKVDELLMKLAEFAKRNSSKFAAEGMVLMFLMRFIMLLFAQMPPIISYLVRYSWQVGRIIFWVGVTLFIVRILLNVYFSLKGIK